jgi:protein-disulfide isomerase
MAINSDVARLSVPVSSRDHAQGAANAAVTLVEYGDFECPHCGRAHPIVKELQRRLGKDLRIVFRHFPLKEIHPHAEHAAEVAEAAAAQGKFWEMHDRIFEHQRDLRDVHLLEFAAELGLDVGRAKRELEGDTHAPRVREDFLSGVRSGVNGTPTFFINGIRHDASWDVETLEAALRAEIP